MLYFNKKDNSPLYEYVHLLYKYELLLGVFSYMMLIFYYIGMFLTPILSIIFCVNLISLITNIKNGTNHKKNAYWLTISFTIIIWTLSMLAIMAIY